MLYTDGVTEAFKDKEEEFGEDRLIDAIRRYRDVPSQDVPASIINAIQGFSGQEQHDDFTLIVAKRR